LIDAALAIEHGDDELDIRNELADIERVSLDWLFVREQLLDICIALHPLDLPPYVILEIVDKIPFWSSHVNRKKKIDFIVQITNYCDGLIDARK
jgi:hypothetical protein